MLTLAERAEKMAKFFGIKQPKDISFKEWDDKLLDMEIEYEQSNGTKVPFYTYVCHIPCIVGEVHFEAGKLYNIDEDWKYIDDNGKVAIIPPHYKEYFVYKQ